MNGGWLGGRKLSAFSCFGEIESSLVQELEIFFKNFEILGFFIRCSGTD